MTKAYAFLLQFPAAGLFALLILGGIGLPFPEDTTLILCGFLVSRHLVHPARGIITVYLGLLCADSLVYLFGKKYGRRIVTHRRFHKLLSPQRLEELERKFNERGVWFILIGRHLAGLRVQLLLTAGVMRMPYYRYIAADALSAFFTMGLMIGIGYVGGNSWEALRKDVSRVEHLAMLAGAVAVTGYVIYRHFTSRRGT